MWSREEKIIEMRKEKNPFGNSVSSFLITKTTVKEVNVIPMGY